MFVVSSSVPWPPSPVAFASEYHALNEMPLLSRRRTLKFTPWYLLSPTLMFNVGFAGFRLRS